MPGIEMMQTLQLFLEAHKGRSKSSWVLSDPEGRDLAQRFDFRASSPASHPEKRGIELPRESRSPTE